MLFSGLVVFLKATTRGHCGTEAAWLSLAPDFLHGPLLSVFLSS